jgi:hypothetical protein
MRRQQLRLQACPFVGNEMPKLTHLPRSLAKVLDGH